MLGFEFFDRWYVAGCLLLIGAYWVLRAKQLNSVHRFVDATSPEMEAAIERRESLENLSPHTYQIPGAISILLGAAVIANIVPGILAYALTCTALVASLAAAFLRLRNRGVRRAALLEPRRITAVIWPVWFLLGALAACAPLALADVSALRIPAILCALCSFVMYALALQLNTMPALLSGENIEEELKVEETLRDARVNGLFKTGIAAPFVFIVIGAVAVEPTPMHVISYWIAVGCGLLAVANVLVHFIRRGKPTGGNVHVS